MSHPKICPCPNCLVAGNGPPRLLMVVVGAGVAYAAVKVWFWMGQATEGMRGLFVAVAAVASFLVIGGIVRAISASIRCGRSAHVATARVDDVMPRPRVTAPPVVQPEPGFAIDAWADQQNAPVDPEPAPVRLRVVRRDVA